MTLAVLQVWMTWMTQLRFISAAYFALEALAQNAFRGNVMDCSDNLADGFLDSVASGLRNASQLQLAVINQLKQPQPG